MRRYTFIPLFILCMAWTQSVVSQQLVFSGIEGSVNSDISMRVLREAYKKLNIHITYRPLPGERAIQESNNGDVDGEVFRISNVQKKYTNLIMVPTQINVLQAVVFSKEFAFEVNGWSSLVNYNIGIQLGIKFAERGTKGMNRIMVDTNEQLFKMLNNGRVDIAVAALSNGLKTIRLLNFTDIKILQPPIKEFPLYHYLNKKHADLVPKINDVLSGMKKSGRMKAIRESMLKELFGV